MKKYPIVTLCGSTRFKDEFMRAQKELTLRGCIVISVGLFGHSGDKEVWEGMDENALTETKYMLDDMHKSKIDLADYIYVINPGGYIGSSTWSEICYATMTDKQVESIVPIDHVMIEEKVRMHIEKAEKYAWMQYDHWSHKASDHPAEELLREMTVIKRGKFTTMDPWVPEDNTIPTGDEPYFCHAKKSADYDPFAVYGKKKMARFVEDILMRYAAQNQEDGRRRKMMREIEQYCRDLNMALPKGYPDKMSDDQMQKWIECWDEFDPCPDI